jgi:hypothetical protein
MANNDLESLVVSGKEMNRRLVAEMLAPYVRLDKDGCNIRPLEGWTNLKVRAKILLYLLSRKAMVALDFGLPMEGATAGDVANDTGLKKGAVNPTLRKLLSDRLIDQAKDSRYFIPNHTIERVKATLGEK